MSSETPLGNRCRSLIHCLWTCYLSLARSTTTLSFTIAFFFLSHNKKIVVNEITKLRQSSSIMKEDGEVVIINRLLVDIGERQVNNCFVGKVLTNKMVNNDAFRVIIQQVGKTLNGVKIELVGNHLFLFRLNSESERKKVLVSGIWYFDKVLIVLSKPKSIGNLLKMDFSYTSFQVRFIISLYYV